MSRFATKVRGERFLPSKRLSPVFPSRKEAKRWWAATIRDISEGDLATSADVSKETVKSWRKGAGFPVGDRMMALMSDFPEIRKAVFQRLGAMPGGLSPEEHVLYQTPEMREAVAAAIASQGLEDQAL